MSDPGGNKPTRGPAGPQMPNRFGRSLMGWVIIIALAVLLMTFLGGGMKGPREIAFSDFWTYAENGQIVGTVVLKDSEILGELAEGVDGLGPDQSRKIRVPILRSTYDTLAKDLRRVLGTRAKLVLRPTGWWEGLLPQLLILVLVFVVVWFFLLRRLGTAASGGGFLGNFGRSRHRVLTKEHVKVTFSDVAGVEEAKDEVMEIVEFLRNPRKFQRLGGRIPRGVLLVGEPGCGKTLLAKAIAGEADVPFFSISGSDFVEMFVGVGASRVRDLFKQAKDSSPCIIFLDEIDAVGRRRGHGFNGGGHDEREQTLNAILVEMDGFDSSDQVIVIAATNRMDVLDPALTRPGRFDRQIDVPLPDLKGRYEILGIYAAKVTCGSDCDLHRLARGTPMFSGADLEALVNEAAIDATMHEKDCIEQADLEEARDKVRWGRARKSRVLDEVEREMTAYHEAGHALVQVLLPEADPLHKVSIIPRGPSLGATFALPEKDRYSYSRRYCVALISVALGGRLAEEMFCGDVSSGAQNDIAQATEIAKKMVLDWGMSAKVGLVNYANDDKRIMPLDVSGKSYSERTAEVVDSEIRGIIDGAYSETHDLLEANRDKVEAIAKALVKYETLSAEEVKQIVDGHNLDKPTVGDLIQREQAKSSPSTPEESSDEPDGSPELPPLAEPG
jgi:cell division protease FtsH